MKKFIIMVAIAATVSGIVIGYGIKKLFELMGANVFLPSTILSIYGFAIMVCYGFALYWSGKYLMKKHREEEKEKMRAEILNETGLPNSK